MRKIKDNKKIILLLALLMVMLLSFSGCRYRLTEDTFANTTDENYSGMSREDYDTRREELGITELIRSIFRKGKTYQQPEIPQYDEADEDEYDDFSDYEDDFDEDEDEDEEEDDDSTTPTTPGTSTSTSSYTRPGTSTYTTPSTTTPTVTSMIATLDPNGGTCTTVSVRVTYNSTYGYLPTPTWTGHTFKGWYSTKSSSKGQLITSTTRVTKKKNHVLYARWDKEAAKKYTVTLNSNGGETATSSFEITQGSKFPSSKLITPKRKNYSFTGWYTSPAEGQGQLVTSNTTFNLTTDLTLYAHWQNTEEYWDGVLADANSNVVPEFYYIEYESRGHNVDTSNNYDILYNFNGVNVADYLMTTEGEGEEETQVPLVNGVKQVDEDDPDDPVTKAVNELSSDQKPKYIIKCIDDMSKKSSVKSKTQSRFPGCQVIVIPSKAVKDRGTQKDRLYWSLDLTKELYNAISSDDLKKAAKELGIK